MERMLHGEFTDLKLSLSILYSMDRHFQALDHQDWKPVVVRTSETQKEERNKSSRKLSEGQQKDIKLMKQVEEGDLQHKKVSPEIRKQIQQGRGTLKWTQKQLAQKVNLQVSVINEIETGKSKYNPQHISKIKRALGIT